MNNKKSKKNIVLLGMVSLFTDLSTQMIYPLIPEFLVSIGAKKAVIGIIEGVAESTASLFRPIFGRFSDKLKKRKLFIYLGYGLYGSYLWHTVYIMDYQKVFLGHI